MDDSTAPESVPFPRRRLGRGLSSLLGDGGEMSDIGSEMPTAIPMPVGSETGEYQHISVDSIERSPFQPRREFEESALAELANSVAEHGVLQPLLVRSTPNGFQLIAGERRLLAARRAGLPTVPCRVLQMEDRSVNEVAIIENLQRADLNELEKALAFQDYLTKHGSSIEELARKLGKDRSTVSNCLRLLELPDFVKLALQSSRITAGHARALLPLETEAEQIAMCQRIQSEGMSVRHVEEAVRAAINDVPTVPFKAAENTTGKSSATPASNYVVELQQQLRDLVGVKVEIRMKGKDSGKMIIHFTSNDEFERVVGQLRKSA